MSGEPPQADGTGPVAPGQLTDLLLRLAQAPAEAELGWAAEPLPGDQVDRFVIVRRVGQGGFGSVFEARDERLKRAVALKLVRAAQPAGPASERLYLEAEAAARLSHPNIVTLFDVGQCPRGPYLVQELLRGESLSERLKRGPLAVAEAVRVGVEVARALAHAHRHAVIHRDLKPGNVFLCEDGQVKVLDFGMAHAFGQPRLDGGTPAFMAPEQRSGAPEDERTDVYALGVTLFQLLTGEFPFGGDGLQHPRLAASRLVLPETPELAALVERMLEQQPVRRPRDGAAAQEALQAIAGSLHPAPAGPARPVRRRRRWDQALLVAAVAVAVSVATIGAEALRRRYGGKEQVPARLLLAVADVVNETGEKELELSGLLRTVLEQSTFLEVLPRGRLIDALSRPPEDGPVSLDEATAQAAARIVRARYLLLARLLKLGETYLLEVRALEPSSGKSAFSFKEQVLGKDALGGLVDQVGEQARLLLGEEAASIRTSNIPAGLVTGNLEAWRAYSRGLSCFDGRSYAGTFGPCLEDFERAVAIDPGFAMAHLQIALLNALDGRPRALQQLAVKQAQAHADRVPPLDRGRLVGWAAWFDGREEEAKQLFRRAAAASPGDKYGWYLASLVPNQREEFDEALPLLDQVYRLDPNWRIVIENRAMAMGAVGDLDGLRKLARELLARGRDGPALASACYVQLWTSPGDAVATCRRAMESAGFEEADTSLAIALLNAGPRAELDRLLTEMHQRASREWKPDTPRGFAWSMQLWLLGQAGRWDEVERIAREEGVQSDGWFLSQRAELLAGAGDADGVARIALRMIEIDSGLATNLAVHLAYLGDLKRASDLSPYLPPGSPRLECYQTLVRWRSGDLAGAIAQLRRLATQIPVSVDPAIPSPLFLLGEALAEAGSHAEAVETLRRYRRLPQTYPTWFWPRAEWLIARSLERQGDLEGARAALKPVLQLWSNASPRQPHLQEARELAVRLGIR